MARIGICIRETIDPGGLEVLAHKLRSRLVAQGDQAEIVTVPFHCIPQPAISAFHVGSNLEKVAAGMAGVSDVWLNFLRLTRRRLDYDAIVTLDYICHYLRHAKMLMYFVSHDKIAYDMSSVVHRDLKGIERIGHAAYMASRRTVDMSLIKRLRQHTPIFAISHNVAKRLERYWRISPRGVIYPGGFDPSFYHESSEYVLYFGRLDWLTKRMGFVYKVAEELPDVPFLVAGGPVHPLVDPKVLKPPPNVRLRLFDGLCPRDEKRRIYARASCILFPAYDEDFGIVPVEGMSAGKPCVACTDGGGVTETIVHGETGLLVSPEVESLAKAVVQLHKSGDSMRSSCRRRAEFFSWDKCLDQLASEIRGLL